MTRGISYLDVLEENGDLDEVDVEALKKTASVYPVRVTPYYFGLIDRKCIPDDPVWKQCMPDVRELEDDSGFEDPQEEKRFSPCRHLVRRYPDRAVLLATSRCAVRCRFCFRKRLWASDSPETFDIEEKGLREICSYLRNTPGIREILVSGGDPLMLKDMALERVLQEISAVDSVEVIRIATRMPVVSPGRITDKLAEMFKKFPCIWIMTHFNHPVEVTPESMEACRKFICRGMPVLNQSVLLKGVNDNAGTLEALFRALVRNKIKPHYLFHVDRAIGVTHFTTGIDKGLEILRQFRSTLSSLAVPAFALDLPSGGGKVNLQPDYRVDGCFTSIEGEKIRQAE